MALAAVLVAACSPEVSDGPRTRICGQWVGRAEEITGSGPFYVDASAASPAPITAAVHSSPIWVQLTGDCAHGVRDSISNPAVLGISGTINPTSGGGGDIAVLVELNGVGHAVLNAPDPVGFTVIPQPSPPPVSATGGG